MRILLWHGWLLEGSGSNVYAAKLTEVMRKAGHEVWLVCQERHPERHAFLDAWATAGPDGMSSLTGNPAATAASGRAILIRPEIGSVLPVFVLDEYEGITPRRFVDLTDAELDEYLERNVNALRSVAETHRPDVVIAGHAVPGPVVAARALGGRRYLSKIHGSDIEYAVREQQRYRRLAAEGLERGTAVIGPSADVLDRLVGLVPAVSDRIHVVHPGVDAAVFRPDPRRDALPDAARRLEKDPALARGRLPGLDDDVARAVAARDAGALDRLALAYDQQAPDAAAPGVLRELARE
ncbi:MAG: glycosyltransferase, partial [Actinomycetota bacterium]